MTVSLRGRLILTLVVLAGAGMLVLGAATYAALRSYEVGRIDEQATAAIEQAHRQFTREGVAGAEPAPVPRPDRHRGPGDRGHGPLSAPGGIGLAPAGTYAEQLDAAGRVIAGPTVLALPSGETKPAAPELPAHLSAGYRGTVGSTGTSELRYRVYAAPTPQAASGLTVVAVPYTEIEATLERLLVVEALVIGGVLVALAAAASWLVRLGLRPLDRIGATADAIAAGDLSHRVERAEPRTEVGRLGLALNAMLGRLEQAFAERRASEERLRRFLADASHELRTPLASIRGYAELFRIGAARDGPDVEKAMTRIEDESARMGVLVEDLLALARLDEVRDSHREPVDLAALAGDAVDDARAVAPDREIELHGAGNGAVVVDGDPGQLRQVLANLVRNALVHTPAGTPVEVTVRARDGQALLEVRDHGRGLPTSDPSELFDRFWRADPGRGRGRAGAGLGLAIVAGVVSAHGGRAEAADAEGGGARFTVLLPLRADPPG
ncbi:MAG: two-component system, OmpR family, sensor kinase [Solirubrobacteraceae bacterium]|nr:two-component system, OmpR family, sensor kinase [Solirubrobacteraceae bacterium]